MSIQQRTDSDAAPLGPTEDATAFEEEIWANLDEIPDPHIPVSLVEMAMIYDVHVEQNAGGADVRVEMTFPCMGCPAYDMILDDVRACLRTMAGVDDVDVDVVWSPVWEKSMLTQDVREKMRESGIAL
ncbi:metal-sulfur cluster assembly factor [Halogeometricum luteum]|uniref:Metal-sulfur cluster assembly factor n=1 Tax=Halogeometricum luteum TaxID=2950537 RepID=A0ABU2G3Z6_9EURY|nr:metal-sulfur cluster assembly factor [Halogeometricum sp. S3BR5-2]MDS0295526.1 metal-sulfur cluster assembly factor [Halogeometricum sp. S3BR5-2]